MAVSTIPFSHPFLETLARGVLDRYGQDPLMLARTLILLPTRRGCLNLKAILQNAIREGKDQPKIFPRIIALADLEHSPILPGFVATLRPPEMPKIQQLGLLSQLILAFDKNRQTPGNTAMGPGKALSLAEDLLGLFDEIHTSDVDPSKLKDLVGLEFAHHWQMTLDFLKIMTDIWPSILSEKGFMESSIRRRENLRDISKFWRPTTPVILAGTTATRPATADLAIAISQLDQGHVVLPGYEAPETLELPPTHPHYTLQEFVKKLDVAPATIPSWGEDSGILNKGASFKKFLLSRMMAPTLEDLHRIDIAPFKDTPVPFTLIECQDSEHEAAAIALLIRQILERRTPCPTIAVITPDQELTRRLQTNLRRWNIVPNTSSGTPLGRTVVGTFLSLITHFHRKMSPVDWLSLLKHPLFFHHRDRGAHLNQCRQLDLHLRKHSFSNLFNIKTAPEPLQEWYDDILSLMAPLISLTGQHALDLLIKTLLQVSETLCAPDDLWKGADGIAAHAFLQEILPFGQDYPAVSLGSFSRLLTQLLNQKIVYSPQGIGSPIRILGALEARQYSADITILAGLNEGTWPKGIESDPWLNNQMRLALGLPDPQRRIGLSAHDFCIGFSNAFANAQSKDGHDHLYLTRSLKDKGTSTLPSRWWQRLEVTLEAMGLSLPLNEDIPMLAKQLDRSLYPVQATAPAPCPPQERRPTAYSVTDIEQLMRDPYTFYAKRILRLKKIDALDRAFEARDFGQLVHKSLDNFQKHSTAQKDLALLMQEGRAVFSPFMGDSLVQRFWWPRFERIAHWLWSKWQNRQEGNLFTELPGNLFLRVGETQIELKTVIDRVEVDRGVDRNSEEPSVHIIDYKTGYLPTQKDVAHGFSPQLPLEALIFLNGGCGINPGETDAIRFKEAQLASLQYWWLKGGSEGGEIRPTSPKDLEELLATTKSGVINLLRYITQENTPYLCCPWDESMAGNRDYHHLARLKEWQG